MMRWHVVDDGDDDGGTRVAIGFFEKKLPPVWGDLAAPNAVFTAARDWRSRSEESHLLLRPSGRVSHSAADDE